LKTKIHWIPAYAGMTIFFAFAEMTTFGLGGLNGYFRGCLKLVA
jgi:hypothetical protein